MAAGYLQGLVVPLQLPAQALQLAAGQDGLAVLALQVDLLLHYLRLFLLHHFQTLLLAAALLQLHTGNIKRIASLQQLTHAVRIHVLPGALPANPSKVKYSLCVCPPPESARQKEGTHLLQGTGSPDRGDTSVHTVGPTFSLT